MEAKFGQPNSSEHMKFFSTLFSFKNDTKIVYFWTIGKNYWLVGGSGLNIFH